MKPNINSTNKEGETKIGIVSSSYLRKKFPIIFFTIFVLIFFALPIIKLALMSFRNEEGYTLNFYRDILTSKRTWTVLKNTVIMVLGSTFISSAIGLTFAYLMAYSNIRMKKVFNILIYLPFIIPSYVSSLAWVQFLGKGGNLDQIISKYLPSFNGFNGFNLYSLGGIIVVLGFTTYPLVYLFTVNALRRIPKECDLASRISGASRIKTFFKITLPMTLPGFLAGTFIAFLSALDNFGIPAFLGSSGNITVLTTYIYQQVTGFGITAFNKAAVLSVILGIIALIALVIQWLFLINVQRMEAQVEDYKPRFNLGKKRIVIEVIFILFFLLTSILPLFSLIVSPFYKVLGEPLTPNNFTLDNYSYILTTTSTRQAIGNSVRLSLVTSILALIVGTIWAYYRVKRKNRLGAFLESLITIPYALPGTVFALSMIFAWIDPIPGLDLNIYGSFKILYIAYFTRFLSLQVRSSVAAFQNMDISIEEASRISGGSILVTWRKVIIPLILKSALGGTFLVFLMSLTELTVSFLLYSSKSQTIGVSILSFQQAGYLKYATAFSSLIVLLILIGFIFWWLLERFLKRKEVK